MNTVPTDLENEFNRRDFLRGSSMATIMALLGGVELTAQTPAPAPENPATGPKVKCAVIGLGTWAREILGTLAQLPKADVVAICDNYPAFLKRAGAAAPKATPYEDYRKILDDKEIQAVIVATPSHLHKEIVLAALQAGKHVYCEAPLATTVEDAKAIAQAAQAATKSVFQSGLQMRSDPQRHFLLQFIRAGAMGKNVLARSQWHKKESWRRTSPNPDRERDLNWRLSKSTSPGLLGEIGLHQIDMASWFLRSLPTAVSGFGSILNWSDGRDVADTVQAVFEYPDGVNLMYDCALTNSFDADYEMYYGTDSAIMIRANKAWMFKEVDSPLLGWEVYARKDTFYKENGIALVANATKLVAQGRKPVEEAPFTDTPLFYSLQSFLGNVVSIKAAVDDFTANFGSDDKALREYLTSITRLPNARAVDGFEATVVAIKANEAVMKRERITFQKEWFSLT